MFNFLEIMRNLVHYKGSVNASHQCAITELLLNQALVATQDVGEKAKMVKSELEHLEHSRIGKRAC